MSVKALLAPRSSGTIGFRLAVLYALGYIVLRVANRWELWQDGKDWWFWADRIWSALSTPAAALLSGSFTTIPDWAATFVGFHPALFDVTVAALTAVALWLTVGVTARIARTVLAASARPAAAGPAGATPPADGRFDPTGLSTEHNRPTTPESHRDHPGLPATGSDRAHPSSEPAKTTAQPRTLHLPEPVVATASTAPTPPAAWTYAPEPAATVLAPSQAPATTGPTERIPAPSRPPQAATTKLPNSHNSTVFPADNTPPSGEASKATDRLPGPPQPHGEVQPETTDNTPTWRLGPSWHDEPHTQATASSGPSWHDEPGATNGGNATEMLGQTTPRRA